MTENTKGRLQDTVENDLVRYRMRYGTFILEGNQPKVIQLRDGSFDKINNPNALILSRDGAAREMQVSTPFNPRDPEDAEKIKRIDDWIEKHPQSARISGLFKVNNDYIDPPGGIKNFYQLEADRIEIILDGTGLDLQNAMRYELRNPQGPREDVLDVLENLHNKQVAHLSDASEEAPVL